MSRLALLLPLLLTYCTEEPTAPPAETWTRSPRNPVLRDTIAGANYQVASDGHVFVADGQRYMVYTGDHDGRPAIKLARGTSWTDWEVAQSLVFTPLPSRLDRYKETPFYRRTADGTHQIYYVGYADEESYQSQIFLAEAEALEGPYTQLPEPVVPRGPLAGRDVYCITSPSVVEHDGRLYTAFLGWNDAPDRVTEVWVIGAVSDDDGRTWSGFQLVDTPIGMEGQVTRRSGGDYVAVRTGEHGGGEAIFYATAPHPFGPWEAAAAPILTQAGAPFELDEIIAPQITIDPATGDELLYYAGADYSIGWWMMLARGPG